MSKPRRAKVKVTFEATIDLDSSYEGPPRDEDLDEDVEALAAEIESVVGDFGSIVGGVTIEVVERPVTVKN